MKFDTVRAECERLNIEEQERFELELAAQKFCDFCDYDLFAQGHGWRPASGHCKHCGGPFESPKAHFPSIPGNWAPR